jgi:hypothetical protein
LNFIRGDLRSSENLSVGLHWRVSRKSAFIFESCIEDNPIRRKIAKPDIPVIDGHITVPDESGLGSSWTKKRLTSTESANFFP